MPLTVNIQNFKKICNLKNINQTGFGENYKF